MIDVLDRYIIKPLNTFGRWLAIIAAAVMMFLVTADVFSRYIFNIPLNGSVEVTELLMIVMVFLGLGYSVTTGSLVSIEVITSKLPKRAQGILGMITTLLGMVYVAMVTWRTALRGARMVGSTYATTTSIFLIPIYPFLFVLAFGTTLLILMLVLELHKYSRRVKKI
jgi:TRAP-type C4-dicarboxylate transport system permease small subunit